MAKTTRATEPLQIVVGPMSAGEVYELHPDSAQRIRDLIPRAVPVRRLTVKFETKSDFEQQHGVLYEHIVPVITGLSWDEIESLGGVHIVDPLRDRVIWTSASATVGA